jgi:hypothetical protein
MKTAMIGKFIGKIIARTFYGERLPIISDRTRARELILKKRLFKSK